jgi:hypothetical protein
MEDQSEEEKKHNCISKANQIQQNIKPKTSANRGRNAGAKVPPIMVN